MGFVAWVESIAAHILLELLTRRYLIQKGGCGKSCGEGLAACPAACAMPRRPVTIRIVFTGRTMASARARRAHLYGRNLFTTGAAAWGSGVPVSTSCSGIVSRTPRRVTDGPDD